MSLIKDTLPVTDEELSKSQSYRPAFKNPIQMLASGCSNKKSVVFPINELEKPTIDSVLNTVPLFYNPITKQLILQQDLEQQCKSINHTISSIVLNKRSAEFNNDKSRPSDTNDKVNRLNNLNKSLNQQTQSCTKTNEPKCAPNSELKNGERKFLETHLDDFTTKSINLSQRPVEIKLINHSNNLVVNHCKIDASSSLGQPLDDLNLDKLNLNSVKSVDGAKLNDRNEQEANQSVSQVNQHQTKKDTYKTHRRTPSYIHDFHNVIKNNQNHQSKSHSSSAITISSAAAAISNLTKTRLLESKTSLATSTLSNTITTSKLNEHTSMHSTTTNHSDSARPSNKQIVFNESKNELNYYDLDTESETGSVFTNSNGKKYSIDDDSIEPLNLPLPYLDKPKKLSLITSPLRSVLSKLTKPTKSAHQPAVEHNANDRSSNDSSRRNSSSDSFSASTNGLLIFENRPLNLPTKSPDEELNHRVMVDQMIRDAKRKEMNDAKQVKKNLIKKKKDEERMLSSIKVWSDEVIPNFEQIRNTKKVKELWSYGLPTNLRGTIWNLAIGNQLNLSNESFNSYLVKWYDSSLNQDKDSKIKDDDRIVNCLSKCSEESVYELIKLDVSRTFPQLKLFQEDAPFYDKLLKLLGTYVIAYRPDIGYIQGMSFILGKLFVYFCLC